MLALYQYEMLVESKSFEKYFCLEKENWEKVKSIWGVCDQESCCVLLFSQVAEFEWVGEVIWTTPREVLGVLPVMLFLVSGSTPNTAIPLLWELCPSVSF